MVQPTPHTQDSVLNKLIAWAEKKDSIRAMLLTSTRSIPDVHVDILSDYDIILVVEDIRRFHEERSWVKDFGEVLVAYWDPIHPEPGYGQGKFGNVIQYQDGLKIDFTLWPTELLRQIVVSPTLTPELDAGYRILLDKDHLTTGIQPPTYRAYIPLKPTNEDYQRHIEEFFSDAPYVAKCLWRDELFPAKWCLDYDMKHVYLRPMLEWRVELDHDWSLPIRFLGKGLKKRLLPDLWSELENTYTGADIKDNWESLFRTMAFFRRVAIEVGGGLGYAYPYELDERVTSFVRDMQSMEKHP